MGKTTNCCFGYVLHPTRLSPHCYHATRIFLRLSRSLARSVAYFYGRVSFLCLNHSGAAHICDGMPLLFPRHDFIVVCSPSLNNSIFACIRSPNEVSSGRQKRNGESIREVSKGPIADQRRWTFLLTKEKEFFFTLIA